MLRLSEFLTYAEDYPLIPLKQTIIKLDYDQLDLSRLHNHQEYALLLESGEYEKETGRFTYFADQPFLVLQLKDNQVDVKGNPLEEIRLIHLFEETKKIQSFELLQTIMENERSPRLDDYPPFTGGAIGYFSYEFIRHFEPVRIEHQDLSPFSEFHLAFVTELLVYDHASQQLLLIYNVRVADDDTLEQKKAKYQGAKIYMEKRKRYWLEQIEQQSVERKRAKRINKEMPITFHQPFSPEQFMNAVQVVKEKIKQGEIFQAVLSQKLIAKTEAEPKEVYQALRELNPSPYMYNLKMKNEMIIGTSPETLVKVYDRQISTFPIAGTRPRGKSKDEEEKLERDLLQDPKEIAEHVMLIDLARNDVGRVSQPGTVKLKKKMSVEKYSHVMHLVSKVTGLLKEEYNALDALKAVFPAGTVSGAPKIRAMQIIAELEPKQRGPYAGAIAALGFNGNLDTCITIRSVFFDQKTAYIQAGAGIVADSEPEKEYMETMNKAKAMLKAIQAAEGVYRQAGKASVQRS